MAWPLSSQFSAMLQTPSVAFRDPEYKLASILRDSQGQPKPWAGAFAVVYKATLPDGRHRAVRVFSSESPERRERYEIVSRYVTGRPKLKCLVDFEYRENAIRAADGKWYPLVLMDWVEGDTLFKWVQARAKERNPMAIRAAAECWVNVVRELEDANISHGDYQQANIMVTPDGQMKLVDYDCMCVPALVGRRNLEIGVDPYQHPQRGGQTPLALDIDRFSALMIFVALRAISADVSLWDRYVEAADYDKLMFKREDISTPDTSALIKDLLASQDHEVAEFTGVLLRAARGAIHDVPQLRAVTSPVRYVEPLLKESRWQDAVEMLDRLKLKEIPSHLRAVVDRAYEEVWKQRAWEEFQNLPEEINEKADRKVARVCNDAFLAQFPVSPEVRQRALAARERVILLDRLTQMVQLSQQRVVLAGERVIASMDENFPKNYVYSLKKRVMRAKETVAKVETLLKYMQRSVPDEVKIAEQWMKVRHAKAHALLTDEQQQRAELAARRAPRLRTLLSITSETPPDQIDRQVLALWDETLFQDCPQAEPFRDWMNTALRRRVKIDALNEAVRDNDRTKILAILHDPLLENYTIPGQLGTLLRSKSDIFLHAQQMFDALTQNDHAMFLQAFDARSLRESPEEFAPVYPTLEKLILSDILPRKHNGLKPTLGRASMVAGEKGVVTLRWTWVQPRFSDVCVLGISTGQPLETDQPWEIPLLFQQEITRAEWEKMGGFYTLQTQREWGGKFVSVWAIIDGGMRKFATEPLTLGKLETPKRGWLW